MRAMIQKLIDECELDPIFERMQNAIESLAPGPEHDQMLGNFQRFRRGVDSLPAKIEALGPYETVNEARAVVEREIHAVLALFKRGN